MEEQEAKDRSPRAAPEPEHDAPADEPQPTAARLGSPLDEGELAGAAPDGRPRLRVALLALTTLLAVFLLWKAVTWPEVARLATTDPETTAFIEQWRATQEELGASTEVSWHPVAYGAISPHLKRAVLVSEDIDFFSHSGFAPAEIRTALAEAWEEKSFPRGASTLTQQLAKNLWLSPSRNPLRKLEEALLTLELERHLSKRRILALYLNVAELGPGIYGAEAAARHYFGIPAAELSEHQAALLAAALPRPRSWNPDRRGAGYRHRVAVIEARMADAHWLWKVL